MNLDEIEENRRKVPTLYAVAPTDENMGHKTRDGWPGYDRYDGSDEHTSTLSPVANEHGWTNDCNTHGYGLPLPVAEALARMPADVDALIARVRELEDAARRVVQTHRGIVYFDHEARGTIEALIATLGESR